MEVFIPALKDANPFFDEIMFHSKNTFIFDDFKKYKSKYKTVLIHWPEQIFNWVEPKEKEINEFKIAIKEWRLHSKIIYVVHNLERHYGMTANFKKLYDLVENNCDAMIHFGNYSQKIFKKKQPSVKHKVIEHPLYEKSYSVFPKHVAHKKLKINNKAMVIIAPGSIRNKKERKLIINSFKKLKHGNKVLIVPRILKNTLPFEFSGRYLLKPFFDVKKVYEYIFNEFLFKAPKYIFKNKFLAEEELSLLISASDIVLIPRVQILNSGNVFLGLTFKKIIVGPTRGNITEVLHKFEMPIFNPDDNASIHSAINKALKLTENYKYNNELLVCFAPKIIAKKWDDFINDLNKL